MQAFNAMDTDGAPPAASTTASRLLDSALGDVTAAAKKRASPYDRRNQDPRDRWQHDKYAEDAANGGGGSGGGARLGSRLSGASSMRDLRGAPPTSAAYMSPKLKIENLHYEVTESALRELFSEVGTLAKAPIIVYDRSGRSTGVAYVLFASAEDAALAKSKFDGQHAHGEPISISFEAYDQRAPRKSDGAAAEGSGRDRGNGRGAAGGGKPMSLLQRVEGRDLLSRLNSATSTPRPNQRRGPNNPAASSSAGAHPRSVSGRATRGPSQSNGGGGGGGGRSRGPKTASDLDAELDAFMRAPAGSSLAQSIHAPKPDPNGDVDMS